MIKTAGIDFVNLPRVSLTRLWDREQEHDICSVTGGVMEAALRTVYEVVTGKELPFDKPHVAPIGGTGNR